MDTTPQTPQIQSNKASSTSFGKIVFGSFIGFILAGGIIALLLFIIISASISSLSKKSGEVATLKDNSVLKISLKTPITDRPNPKPMEVLQGGGSALGLRQAISAIHHAKKDKKINGIYLNLPALPFDLPSAQELRKAVEDFKTSGKFVYSYAEGYQQSAYYFSSVADSVFVHPSGAPEIKGLAMQVMFYKKALEKIGIQPEIIRHGKFKAAVEPFMDQTQMSAPNREQNDMILATIWNEVKNSIAQSRKITPQLIDSIADNALVTNADNAKTYKFIDAERYEDEVLNTIKTKTSSKDISNINFISLSEYSATFTENYEQKEKIAIIYASGEIKDGKGKDGIYSENFVKLIRKARLDDNIKAVVLRVSSPGGSALASDVMWRELDLLKQAGKPLVVSMGAYAASGGYYISAPADYIFAEPTTITGSIGVFGLFFTGEKLLTEKMGVYTDTVKTNNYADIMTLTRTPTANERAIVQREVDRIYNDFIAVVAKGRKRPVADIDSIAQGRVWTGIKAKELGLVDDLGGLEDALLYTAKLLSKNEKLTSNPYTIVEYPETDKELNEFLKQLSTDAEQSAMNEHFGEYYNYYKFVKDATQRRGIQMRLEQDVYIY